MCVRKLSNIWMHSSISALLVSGDFLIEHWKIGLRIYRRKTFCAISIFFFHRLCELEILFKWYCMRFFDFMIDEKIFICWKIFEAENILLEKKRMEWLGKKSKQIFIRIWKFFSKIPTDITKNISFYFLSNNASTIFDE